MTSDLLSSAYIRLIYHRFDEISRLLPGRSNMMFPHNNGDGFLDIFLACIGPDEVWVNDGKGDFSDSKLRLGKEWSWEVAVGDINKDGLPDLFVVNLGVDRTAPPEKMMQSRFAEVWLNTSPKKRP